MGKYAIYAVVLGVLLSCDDPSLAAPLGAPGTLPLSSIDAPSSVRLTATVEYHPKGFEVRRLNGRVDFRLLIRAHNTGADTAGVYTGICNYRLRGYDNASLREPAVWDDRPGHDVVCPSIGEGHTIAPGDSATIERPLFPHVAEDWPPPLLAYYGVVVLRNGVREVLDAGKIQR